MIKLKDLNGYYKGGFPKVKICDKKDLNKVINEFQVLSINDILNNIKHKKPIETQK